MSNDQENIYKLLHTFQAANITLALQLAQAMNYTDILAYCQKVELAITEIFRCDYFYKSEDMVRESLASGSLILTAREIAPLANDLHRIVRSLTVTDERINEPDNIYQGFVPSLYRLLHKFSLLEFLRWRTDFPILVSKELLPLPLLKKVQLVSVESVEIQSLSALAAVEALSISAKEINIKEGSAAVSMLWIGDDQNEAFPEWLALFPNTQSLTLNKCTYGQFGERLGALEQLKTLSILENKVLRKIPEMLTTLPKLETLSLKDCEAIEDFGRLQQLTQLKELNLKNTLSEKTLGSDKFKEVVRGLEVALPNTRIYV